MRLSTRITENHTDECRDIYILEPTRERKEIQAEPHMSWTIKYLHIIMPGKIKERVGKAAHTDNVMINS